MELRGPQNEEEVLIIRFNRTTGNIEDITKRVSYVKQYSNYYIVFFFNQPNKKDPYKFSRDILNVYYKKRVIEVDNKIVFADGNQIANFKRIIDFGSYYKILWSNTSQLARKIELYYRENIPRSMLVNGVYEYYNELAQYASTQSSGETSIESLLVKLYQQIRTVNSHSFLKCYIQKELKSSIRRTPYIHPYGLNLSQSEAIEKAFTSNISIIEGPPGTGKTQTILNIIANALIDHKKVAVVSNNNTAVLNVYEKLEENELAFLCANLGNSENVEKFFEKNLNEPLATFLENHRSITVRETDLNENMDRIRMNLDYQNKVMELNAQIQEVTLEQKHFLMSHPKELNEVHFKKELNVERLLELRNILTNNIKLNFIERLFFKSRYGISYRNTMRNQESLLHTLDKVYYDKKLEGLKENLTKYENYLKKYQFEDLIKNQIKISLIYLKNQIYKTYKNQPVSNFSKSTYRNQSSTFTSRFPVVLSTTHSLLRNVGQDFMFDLLIIDEASQSDILTSILTFNVTKSVVIVGDSKQLPQIDNQLIYDKSDELILKYQIEEGYQYKENSILQSIKLVFPNAPMTLLHEHYRSDPRIIGFSNKKYYSNQLILMTHPQKEDAMVIVKTVPGNHSRKNPQGTGQYNEREMDEIIEILNKEKCQSIGIITPFRYQAELMRKRLNGVDGVEVDTIHKFQGRQKDVIILSTVVNDLYDSDRSEFASDFVTNDKLLNVAISRAKSKLYLVVSDKVFRTQNNSLSDLIAYIQYNFSGNSFVEGKVTSVFDILYKDNYEAFKKLRGKFKRVSDYASENIIYSLIQSILHKYTNLDVAMHVQLRHLLTNVDCFNEKEKRYLEHPWTHVDFLIYNEVTKRVVLAVEVDGVRYHEQNKKQLDHDSIKDRALQENKIPILRLKTNASNEKQRLIEALNHALEVPSSHLSDKNSTEM